MDKNLEKMIQMFGPSKAKVYLNAEKTEDPENPLMRTFRTRIIKKEEVYELYDETTKEIMSFPE